MRNSTLPRTTYPPLTTTAADKPEVRIIPYDYVANFDQLRGIPGTIHEKVINIGSEGSFVAVAMGYGMASLLRRSVEIKEESGSEGDGRREEERRGDSGRKDDRLGELSLGRIPPIALVDGLRVNPHLEDFAFPPTRVSTSGIEPRLDGTIQVELANTQKLFEAVRMPEKIDFLYQIVDTSSGRELQNHPIHNIAGLGEAQGERPFRYFAKPVSYLPRSTIRIQIEERSAWIADKIEGRQLDMGELQIVLHGYKILGAGGIDEAQLRLQAQRTSRDYSHQAFARETIEEIKAGELPSDRLIPYDYVIPFDLTGKASRVHTNEVPVNVEGAFIATAIGYSLHVSSEADVFSESAFIGDRVDVKSLPLRLIPGEILRTGFRVNPQYLRLAFENGELCSQDKLTASRLFESLNVPDRVRFKYRIHDTGTGRDWQDKAVLNVAGLGSATGRRPFRKLAWPMKFLPRTAIRISVEEVFGRGRLYVVMQGYKILG